MALKCIGVGEGDVVYRIWVKGQMNSYVLSFLDSKIRLGIHASVYYGIRDLEVGEPGPLKDLPWEMRGERAVV